MSLSMQDQVHELLQNKNAFLIVLKSHPSIDAIMSAQVLAHYLLKQNKHVIVVSNDFELPSQLSFLSPSIPITSGLESFHGYKVSVDLGDAHIEDVSYHLEQGRLDVFIQPKSGDVPEQSLLLEPMMPDIDVIITLDVQDVEMLGAFHSDNTELFYQTPIINIDHRASNEQFGQINVVELTSVSLTEILYDFLMEKEASFVDEKIATYLLCGIISKTKSFKQLHVTPKALNTVAQLISKGAKREDIVSNLYQTKSVSTLKLWGRVLSRIQVDSGKQLAWSFLNRKDFTKSSFNNESDISDIIDEFISHHLSVSTIVLFYESIKGGVMCVVHAANLEHLKLLFSSYHPQQQNGFMRFHLQDCTNEEAQKRVLSAL